jgi:hypothetical protein
MPLPLIAVAIALFVASGGGVTFGAVGATDLVKAKKIAGRSKERYEAALVGHAEHEKTTGEHLACYGRRQIEVQTTTFAAWVAWLEANERKIKMLDRTMVGGVEVAKLDLPALRKLVNQGNLLQGGSAPLCRQWWPNRPRSAAFALLQLPERVPPYPPCQARLPRAQPWLGSAAARSLLAAVAWRRGAWSSRASPSPQLS